MLCSPIGYLKLLIGLGMFSLVIFAATPPSSPFAL